MHQKRIVRLVVLMDFDTNMDELDHDYLILLVSKDEIYFFMNTVYSRIH